MFLFELISVIPFSDGEIEFSNVPLITMNRPPCSWFMLVETTVRSISYIALLLELAECCQEEKEQDCLVQTYTE